MSALNGHADPADPPDTPRSMRSDDLSMPERMGTIEGWARDIDRRLVALQSVGERQHAETKAGMGELKALVAELAKSVKSQAVQIVHVQRKLSLRDVGTYAVGIGGALAVYEGLRHYVGTMLGGH